MNKKHFWKDTAMVELMRLEGGIGLRLTMVEKRLNRERVVVVERMQFV